MRDLNAYCHKNSIVTDKSKAKKKKIERDV